jgi:aerobic C4-dicarboxylate transport protein
MLQMLFRIVAMVMRLAPIGAGAGVAYTIARYGIGSFGARLADAVSLHHIIGVRCGRPRKHCQMVWLPLLHFLRYFKDEILITRRHVPLRLSCRE